MERITISISDEFASDLASFMTEHRYENRSEAVRDLARLGLAHARQNEAAAGPCIATLSYVFDHHKRDLSKRLTDVHHEHHTLQVAMMHVHLDHDHCLEVAVLRGEASEVRDFAKGVIAERGVTHGHVAFVPADAGADPHAHSTRDARAPHVHLHPKS